MLAKERHRLICRILDAEGHVRLADLARRLGASPATLRRDGEFLAAAGRVARSHGALHAADAFTREPHFRAKALRHAGAKARLAHRAVHLLPHDGNVFVDAGTTCLEVGRLLAERPGLRLYTNSVPLLAHGPEARATLIAIGGEVRATTLALTGALGLAWLGHLRFDAAVLGASGLTAREGAFTTELQEAALKAEVLRRARFRLLVAHAEKWNQATAIHFAPWSAFSALLTDRQLTSAERRAVGPAVRVHHV